MMHSNKEPPVDATISDLEARRQQGPFASSPSRRRWLWSLMLLLVLAMLVAETITSATRQQSPHPQSRQVTPTPSPTNSPTPVSPEVFASLAGRPLQFPAVVSLAACPVSLGRQISPDFGLAAGSGPLYIAVVAANGTVIYIPASRWGDTLGWGGMSHTLWLFQGTFAGPALVRGRRLDASGSVRFNAPNEPLQSTVRIVVQAQPAALYQEYGNWYIRLNAPGCYGLQIDWLQGTERIIFQAQLEQGTG